MEWQGSGSYARVYRPDHPMANASGLICVHRLVASEKLGRPLRGDEFVHHVNGDHEDNRPENLEIVTNAEHMKRHWKAGDFEHLIGPRKERAFEGAGQLIRDLRKAAGIKQGELAGAAGCGQSHLCCVEKGQHELTDDCFKRLLVAIDEIRATHEVEFMTIINRIVEHHHNGSFSDN